MCWLAAVRASIKSFHPPAASQAMYSRAPSLRIETRTHVYPQRPGRCWWNGRMPLVGKAAGGRDGSRLSPLLLGWICLFFLCLFAELGPSSGKPTALSLGPDLSLQLMLERTWGDD